jgi:hypothetical protein
VAVLDDRDERVDRGRDDREHVRQWIAPDRVDGSAPADGRDA